MYVLNEIKLILFLFALEWYFCNKKKVMNNFARKMHDKSELQLNWIIQNAYAFPENEIEAAKYELKKRKEVIALSERIALFFSKCKNWYFI
ncbi:hypothetical protein ES705_12529 [subsurface metagenome]